MKNRTKKLFKITGITLGALIVFLSAGIAFSINFIFTPEKLTPIVLNVANQNINAKLDMNSVELTFFSTFPRFGIKLENGTLYFLFLLNKIKLHLEYTIRHISIFF